MPDPVYLIAERQSMRIGVSGRRESQMFCKQVKIKPSAVRTCSAAPCIILQ